MGMLVSDSLTDSLTHSHLVNLIDVTMACEDGNSKLVEIVTVVDVDDEKRVGNSLLQVWTLKLKVNFFVQSLVSVACDILAREKCQLKKC